MGSRFLLFYGANTRHFYDGTAWVVGSCESIVVCGAGLAVTQLLYGRSWTCACRAEGLSDHARLFMQLLTTNVTSVSCNTCWLAWWATPLHECRHRAGGGPGSLSSAAAAASVAFHLLL